MRHYDGFLKKGRFGAVLSEADVQTGSGDATMIILKSERDLEAMRPACAVAGAVLERSGRVHPAGGDDQGSGRVCGGADQALRGQERVSGLSEVSVPDLHFGERPGGAWPGRRPAVAVRRHREPGCRRDLQRVHRGHGADGGGGRLRRAGAAADGCDGEGACTRASRRRCRATGWRTFRGPFRTMWKATGSAWCGSLSGTASGGRCTKSRRCRISWTASRRRSCGRA